MHTEAIGWTDAGTVRMLDQTRLPDDEIYLDIADIDTMVEAISVLRVRGAPLIGVAAAMGLAVGAQRCSAQSTEAFLSWLESASRRLIDARPTAVNLQWAVERAAGVAKAVALDGGPEAGRSALRNEAQAIWDEDVAMCAAIGQAGLERVPRNANILTVCNTGMLATGGIGTAFGVIRTAHENGRVRRVFAVETRPLRQGARLTAWELVRCGIPHRVLVDGAAAHVMKTESIDLVIAGADRIAANGDSANKIGTFSLAVLARSFDIPFYIAAPRSTVDLNTLTGDAIPIEQRAGSEIGNSAGVSYLNPAFDVTPASLIRGIITDVGIMSAPYEQSLQACGAHA